MENENKIGGFLSRNAKGVIALLGGLGTWGTTAGADGVYTQVELWGLCTVAAAAFTVWFVPNRPPKGEPADPEISEQAKPSW